MKYTALTARTLSRFESGYNTANYTPEQVETIEHAAYVANMNASAHADWCEDDIFADFLRALSVHNITTEPAQPETTEEEENTMKNTLNAIKRTASEVIAKNATHLTETITTIGALRGSWYARELTTPKQFERLAAMQDGEPVPADDLAKMLAKHRRRIERTAAQKSAEVTRLTSENTEAPDIVRVYVTWTRSSVYGWNPHAEVTAYNGTHSDSTHGTASGCGYDKTSAAVAQALNACDMIRAALIRWTESGGKTYGVYTSETVSFPTVPHFEGGCGIECIEAAFRGMGYKVEQYTHCNRRGNTEFKTWTFTREEG